MNTDVIELAATELRRICDPDQFKFESTEELSDLEEIIGQERAVQAISFGIDIDSPGYHMYALGPAGTGKTTTIKKFLERKAKQQRTPDDWCYVNNFDDHDKPRALRMPAGLGYTFQTDINQLVVELQSEIPNAFESEDYEKEQEPISQQIQKRKQELFQEIEKKSQSQGFTMLQTPRGIMLAPVIRGQVISPDEFNKLDEETRLGIKNRQDELQQEMRELMRRVQGLQQEEKEEIRKLDRQVVRFAVEHLIDRLKEKYSELENVVEFLDAIRVDLLENVEAFKHAKEIEQAQQQLPFPGMQTQRKPNFDQYRTNLVVDHRNLEGAPVIEESHPTYANLVGRVEHQIQFGALVTNFSMIKGGSLHIANGGYLMIDVRDILSKPLAWDGLKRALKDRVIRIESLNQALGLISTRTLDPEPIPLEIKVIIIGDPLLYYLLYNLDEDFRELFKVKADFAIQMDWSDETAIAYAKFIGTIVIEQSARMVAYQTKLATVFGDIVDLIRQASYWAEVNNHNLVQGTDVQQAIEELVYRSNRLEERIQELIADQTILIDTHGETVGQVNGIAILPMGDYAFGKPTRITARTFVGRAGVVNIDRETELGGRIHNKGVLILTGYLGGKFALELPMAFSASVTFEQSYEEVEGDSASSAELYALLSSLSRYAIRQNLAVTGSVNQRGQIQAIGGVNEKIEGFFDVCRQNGLTGEQGVAIPQSNVKNLMLREDIVQAVRDGRFHVFPISTIDQGIELLTGKVAGEMMEDGSYPEGSVYFTAQERLKDLARKVKTFDEEEKSGLPDRSENEPT
jgi:predicted ATP-dependent protease